MRIFIAAISLLAVLAGPLAAQPATPIEIIPNVLNFTTAMAFSSDGRRTLSGGSDGTIQLVDVSSGRIIRTFSRHSKSIRSVVFSAGETQFISASEDMTVRRWDLRSGALIEEKALASPSSQTWDIQLSPDGRQVASAQSLKVADANDTIKIWDIATARELRSFSTPAHALAFSQDGSRLLAGGRAKKGAVKLWDVSTGQLLRTFEGHKDNVVDRVAISRDGRRAISSASLENSLKVWDVTSGRLLKSFDHPKFLTAAAISPDGSIAITGSIDGAVRVWNTSSGQLLATHQKSSVFFSTFASSNRQAWVRALRMELFDTHSGATKAVLGSETDILGESSFIEDGATIITGSQALRRWSASTGALLSSIERGSDIVRLVAFTADARHLVWQEKTKDFGTLRTVNSSTGETKAILRHPDGFRQVAISPDGALVATSSGDKVFLWEFSSGRLLRTFEDPKEAYKASMHSVQFSADGRRLLCGDGNGSIRLWNIASGQLIWTYRADENGIVWKVVFSEDERWVLSTVGTTGPRLLDAATGRLVRAFPGHRSGYLTTTIAISKDGSRILSGGSDNTIRLFETSTGQVLRVFDKAVTGAYYLAFSPDGRRLLLGPSLFDANTGEKLATFVVSRNEWLAMLPEGYFAASERGGSLLNAVRGLEVFGIDQFFQSLYRPDLVREKLAGDPRGLVREAAAKLDLNKVVASGAAPLIQFVSPNSGTNIISGETSVEVELTEQGGGAGRIEWRVNGLTVGVQAGSLAAGQVQRITRRLTLDTGQNAIEVTAYNSANLISASAELQTVALSSGTPSTEQQPKLFVLAAGVNEYVDRRFRLAFSIADATAIGRAFVSAGATHYRNVEVKTLLDADVTRDKLDAAFKDISGRMSPQDVFVLHIAGHGKTTEGRYYFAPQNFKVDGAISNAAIDAAVAAQGISQDTWQSWFALVPARRSIILFDTCESGTLAGDDAITKALEQGAANEKLSQATGRSIITASSGSAEAFEGYRGHGLFTYNVLDALDRADSDRNGTIEVTELAAYVYAQVTDISEKTFKKRQEPQLRISSDYSIARKHRVLSDDNPAVAMQSGPIVQLRQEAQLQIRPTNGATVVRSLASKTPVTVVRQEGDWTLVAIDGKPVGYVGSRDIDGLGR